ncbi:hypothetical protein [Luteolibacter marinus]|uniref:hypothetical protein n=1 Tax=Luteolibacter marinus TaxID=2776705 RepID=UPI0018676E85|nr:hypothetical protein [Luteolibacter marinus]
MKKSALLHLSALLLVLGPVSAQQTNQNNQNNDQEEEQTDDQDSNAEETEINKRFWEASLAGGDYMVALDRISSVSIHQYVLDAQLLVTEVVIDTNGRALARFYHVASVAEDTGSAMGGTIAKRGADLLDRAGQRAQTDVLNLAQKNYPTTSHAGMIEYRVLNRNDVQAIFRSAKGAWESGKGRKITIH